MEALFEGIQREKLIEWEFHAAIHGVDIGGNEGTAPVKDADPAVPLFSDPEDYQSMSLEAKEEATKKMKSKHQRWSGQSFLKGK